MTITRLLPLAWKFLSRRAGRSALTVVGVAAAMCLFAAIGALRAGVREATAATAKDVRLIVYRESRFCPFTSRLPERYEARIREIPGVTDVVPMKIVVSNCRASLDVITFRGVRKEEFAAGEGRKLRVVSGSVDDWLRRSDAALVGRLLAERRGVRAGDRFVSAGVTVTVAGIYDSDDPQDRNVAYVDLEFLQRAPGVSQLGIVTQFLVTVARPEDSERVSAAIDAAFRSDQEPTSTRSEKAFVARAATDVMALVDFTGLVAAGCVAAVLALVANAIVMSVRDRVGDFAVMQTLGYTPARIAALVVVESSLLGTIGGLLGTSAGLGFLAASDYALSSEGLSITFDVGGGVWALCVAVSVAVGVAAGLVPAWRAARVPVAASFRAV